MSGRARMLVIAGIAMVTLGVLFASGSGGSAATFEGTWSIYERQDATSFVAGNTPVLTANPLPGHEIVGMGAVGVTTSLADYKYWGLAAVPVELPIVSCSASITQPVMSLSVVGAYPFAGCVFFLGVKNTGESPLTIELGSPGSDVPISCGPGTCSGANLDVLAGGKTPAEAASLCRAFPDDPGTPGHLDGVSNDGSNLRYIIAVGTTFVCPVFLVVLQPACENCTYHFEITPPTPTPPLTVVSATTPSPTPITPDVVTEPTPTPTLPGGGGTVPTPTNTPVPATSTSTSTLTPVSTVAGVRTPGPGTPTAASALTPVPTPRPPDSGTGLLVVRGQSGEPPSILPIVLLSLATLLCLAIAWPAGRRRHAASHVMAEAAGGAIDEPLSRAWSACRRLARRGIDRLR